MKFTSLNIWKTALAGLFALGAVSAQADAPPDCTTLTPMLPTTIPATTSDGLCVAGNTATFRNESNVETNAEPVLTLDLTDITAFSTVNSFLAIYDPVSSGSALSDILQYDYTAATITPTEGAFGTFTLYSSPGTSASAGNPARSLTAIYDQLIIDGYTSLLGDQKFYETGSWQSVGNFFLKDPPIDATYANYVQFVSDVDVTTAVPEPESYAMLLAGLGLLGFVARRRARTQSA